MSTEPSKTTKPAKLPKATAVRAEPVKAEVNAEDGAGTEATALPLPSWVRRLAAIAAIAIGWGFIAWHNHFYLTPPVVILALGWAASISTLYFLWRVGAAGAEPAVAREDWWLLGGQREDLEREKRALLKTIREIEFDHQTGKLSSGDAEQMTQVVRARAIEVMKALDAEDEDAGDARAQIEREVRARLEVEKARKAGKKAKGIVSKQAVTKAAAASKAAASKAAARMSDQAAGKAPAQPGGPADQKSAESGGRSATAINVSAAADAGEARPLDEVGEDRASTAGEVAAGTEAPSGADLAGAVNEPPAVDSAAGSGDDAAVSAKAAATADAADAGAALSSSPSSAPSERKSSEVSA